MAILRKAPFGFLYLCMTVVLLTGCNKSGEKNTIPQKSAATFKLLSSDHTGINYINENPEDEGFNAIAIEYYYNGAGIAAGDINNDGLPDLYFASNYGKDQLYLNQGNLKFKNISESAGIIREGYKTGVCMVDINADGWLDIYVCRSFTRDATIRKNLLFLNNGDLTFTESAEKYGLADPGYSNQAIFQDFDNDNDLDLYLLNYRLDFHLALTLDIATYPGSQDPGLLTKDPHQFVSDRLYENDGNGNFVDVTAKKQRINHAFGLSATCGDLDQNRAADIFVANDFADPDHLLMNNGKLEFRDELTDRVGHISRNSMGSDIGDLNNDGWPEIVCVDMVPETNHRQKTLSSGASLDGYYAALNYGKYHQVIRNMLQLNNGNGSFSEIGAFAGISHTDWSWAPVIADLDNDGWQDIYISNGYKRDVTNLDYIKYKSVELTQLAGGIENVKQLDLLAAMNSLKLPNYVYQNNGDLTFSNVAKSWNLADSSFSHGVIATDLDNDGDLDLVVQNITHKPFIYQNLSADSLPNHHLQVTLKGPESNSYGIGAKAILYTRKGLFYRENQISKGYLSSSTTPIFHFGLGKESAIDSLVIYWQDGKKNLIPNPSPDQNLQVLYSQAYNAAPFRPARPKNYLSPTASPLGMEHIYFANIANDLKAIPLLEHRIMDGNIALAKTDVKTGDFQYLYIGGDQQNPGVLYQKEKGKQWQRLQTANQSLNADKLCEDKDAVFADVDSDGDQDLIVISGSLEATGKENLIDRIYINHDDKTFKRSETELGPQSSSNCLTMIDYDLDGDEDLFIGGGLMHKKYPYGYFSKLYRNDNGNFKDVTTSVLPKDKFSLITTKVATTDLDGDRYPELITVHEWGPVTIWWNEKGKTFRKEELPASGGIWSAIKTADLDGDGDQDLICGNRGLNEFYGASQKHPAYLYTGDLDQNDIWEAIPTYYYPLEEKSFPRHQRDVLGQQLPLIRSRFISYEAFGTATISDIFYAEELSMLQKLSAETFASTVFLNEGKSFKPLPLSYRGQFAPVNDILITDLNNDNIHDLILAGNDHWTTFETGRYDAMGIQVLLGKGDGTFSSELPPVSSPHKLDPRKMVLFYDSGEEYLLVANYHGKLNAFKLIRSSSIQ